MISSVRAEPHGAFDTFGRRALQVHPESDECFIECRCGVTARRSGDPGGREVAAISVKARPIGRGSSV
jgi:hypothetical protein